MTDQRIDSQPYVILVAEDHPDGLKTVRIALEKGGYTVLEARDGRSALDKMARHPDLVILDVVLPDMDGFELARQIRRLPGGAEVPIIAYCGVMTKQEEDRSIEVGFTDYLFKPITPARLIDTVEAYLPPKDGPQQVGAGQRLLVVDDDTTHLNLIKTRLVRAGFTVEPFSDAAEALARAHQAPPDLIMADVLMPKIDGFQFCLAVRKDAALTRVPVVLFSSAYNEDTDRQLARDAGANVLVLKSPGCESIIAAAGSTLGAAVPEAAALTRGLGEDYTRRLAQQLDHQMILNATIRKRLMRREADLAVISTVLDSLTHGSVAEILGEMLSRIRHTAGLSRGIIYLVGPDGKPQPRVHAGYPYSLDHGLGDFFGHADVLDRVLATRVPLVTTLKMPREILSKVDRAEQSVLLAPILSSSECLGVLVMSSGTRALTEEMLPFAKTVGTQMGQALGLIDALADAEKHAQAHVWAH